MVTFLPLAIKRLSLSIFDAIFEMVQTPLHTNTVCNKISTHKVQGNQIKCDVKES